MGAHWAHRLGTECSRNLRSFGHFLLQVSAESIILNWMGVFLVNPSPSDIVFPMYMISISTDTTQITTMKRSDLETKVAQGLNKCLCTRQHLMLRLDECSVVWPKLSFWMPLPINIICSAIHIIRGQSYIQGQSYQPKGWCCAKVGTIQLLPVNKVFHTTQ
jgi:hypothetical protein